jgi:GNAT superfamily N-acetyltransferase
MRLNPMFTIRPMIADDVPAGLALCRAARWNQLARDWEQFLSMNPDGARVAVVRGRVVATVTTIDYGGRFGWIGMVLVDEAERRRGLGTAMLTAGLQLLERLPRVRLDATPAGYSLYRTLGFEEEYRLVRLGRRGSSRLSPSPPMAVRRLAPADRVAMAAWDLAVFGAPRPSMLDWLAAGAPAYAWVAEDSHGIAGWMLGRHGFSFDHLGPIVARDQAVAAALVAACLEANPSAAVIVDAPDHSPEWLAWLDGSGFSVQRPFIRMGRGGTGSVGTPGEQFAIVGPEFG